MRYPSNITRVCQDAAVENLIVNLQATLEQALTALADKIQSIIESSNSLIDAETKLDIRQFTMSIAIAYNKRVDQAKAEQLA